MAERRRHKKRIQVAWQSRGSGAGARRKAEGAGKTSEWAGGRRMSRRGRGAVTGLRRDRAAGRSSAGSAGRRGRKGGRWSGARNPAPGPAFLRRRRAWNCAARPASSGARTRGSGPPVPSPFFLALSKLRPRWLGWEAAEGGPEGRAAALCSGSPAPGPACGLPVQMLGGVGPPLPLWSSFNRTAYWTLAGSLPGDAM